MTKALKKTGRPKPAEINLSRTVRILRKERQISGADLCRKAGDLDPKTLTAFEKGRIKNPSMQTLASLARGLGTTVSSLFRQAELGQADFFYFGNQKGAYKIDFPSKALHLVSFTPFTSDFFVGKAVFESRGKVDQDFFKHTGSFFIMVLIGKFRMVLEDRELELSEGENLFFKGALCYKIQNMRSRSSVLQIVSIPSFLHST